MKLTYQDGYEKGWYLKLKIVSGLEITFRQYEERRWLVFPIRLDRFSAAAYQYWNQPLDFTTRWVGWIAGFGYSLTIVCW